MGAVSYFLPRGQSCPVVGVVEAAFLICGTGVRLATGAARTNCNVQVVIAIYSYLNAMLWTVTELLPIANPIPMVQLPVAR